MKKFFGKLVSVAVSVLMLVSLIPSVAIYASDEDPDIAVLADFSTAERIASYGNLGYEASVEQVWDCSETSLKFPLKAGETSGIYHGIKDFTPYKYMVVRMYATHTGGQFVIASWASEAYRWHPVKITKTGWQEMKIPLSVFGHRGDWADMQRLYFNVGGWETKENPDHTIYIDKVWLEKNDVSKAIDGKEDDKVLFELTSDSITGLNIAGNVTSAIEYENTRPNGNGRYVNLTVPAETGAYFHFTPASTMNVETSKYLNMWVYTPYPVHGGFHALLYSGTSSAENIYVANTVSNLDWNGWKCISFPLYNSNGTLNTGAFSKNTASFDLKSISQFSIICNEWDNMYISEWYTPGSFGIEKIWFSAEKPTEQTITYPETMTPTVLPSGNLMIKEFGSLPNLVSEQGNTFLVANGLNNHFYGMNTRFSFDDLTASNGAAAHLFYTGSKTSDKNITPQILAEGGYNYINAWVYSPGPKYNGGKPSDLIFVAQRSTSSYDTYPIPIDWTGWKIVSMPISETTKASGFYWIHFTVNGWAHLYNTWSDTNNYVDIDRVWLSQELPQAPVMTESSVANGDLIFYEDASVLTYTFNNELASNAAEHMALYRNNELLTQGIDYTINANGKNVTLALTDPQGDSTYSFVVKEGASDFNGQKLGRSVTEFSTYSYEIGRIVVNQASNSATVSVKGNLPEEYKGLTLVAVEISGNKLVQVTPATYVSGNITAALTKAPASGSTVKFMLLGGMGNIKPLAQSKAYVAK